MIHIIYPRLVGISARLLSTRFQAEGYDVARFCADRGRRQTERPDFIIPWGWSGRVQFLPQQAWLNDRDAIRIARNGLRTLQVLREAGISVPEFGDLREGPPTVFPSYLRTAHHAGGRGLKYCEEYEDFLPDRLNYSYWIAAITGADRIEYRIHADGDANVLLRQRKFFVQGEPEVDIVRNRRNGWHLSVQDTARGVVVAEGRRAVAAIGLSIGAADVIFKDGRAYVLEVNSAPSVRFHRTLDTYFNYFKEVIDEART